MAQFMHFAVETADKVLVSGTVCVAGDLFTGTSGGHGVGQDRTGRGRRRGTGDQVWSPSTSVG